MGMTIDFTEFEKTFKALVEGAIPKEIGKGLFRAGNALLHDAIYLEPKAPFDEGHLRGSARVEEAKIEKGDISTRIGFNIKYAARWHEISQENMSKKDILGRAYSKHWPINWSLKGSGPKYLESKMIKFKSKYMEIVADYLGKLLRK